MAFSLSRRSLNLCNYYLFKIARVQRRIIWINSFNRNAKSGKICFTCAMIFWLCLCKIIIASLINQNICVILFGLLVWQARIMCCRGQVIFELVCFKIIIWSMPTFFEMAMDTWLLLRSYSRRFERYTIAGIGVFEGSMVESTPWFLIKIKA